MSRYKIGEFAKLVNIPVGTLRYYDALEILKPTEIDQFTGYRYYTDQNITECEFIKLLKSYKFTLEEIYLYKNNLTKEVLENKKQELLIEINLLNSMIQGLTILQNELNSPKKVLTKNN